MFSHAKKPMQLKHIEHQYIDAKNENYVLSIINVAKNTPFSTCGCNYANSITNNIHEWYSNIMPDEILCMDKVRELIEVRDGRKIIAGLDRTELPDLLDSLCTE